MLRNYSITEPQELLYHSMELLFACLCDINLKVSVNDFILRMVWR